MNSSIKNNRHETEDIFLFLSDDEDSAGEESKKNSNFKSDSIVNTNNFLHYKTPWSTQYLNHKESCVFLTESNNEDKDQELFDDSICLYDIAFKQDALPRADLLYTNIPDKEISKTGFIPRVIVLSEKRSMQAGRDDQNEGQKFLFMTEPNDNDRANEELGHEPVCISEGSAKSDEMWKSNYQSSTNNNLSQFNEDNGNLIEVSSTKRPLQTENVDLREEESCIFVAESYDYNKASEELRENYVCADDSQVKLDKIFNLQPYTNTHQSEFCDVNNIASKVILPKDNFEQTRNADCRDSCVFVTLSDGKNDDENVSKDPVTITETVKPDKNLKLEKHSSTRSDSPESLNVNQGSNEIILLEENSEQTGNVDCRGSSLFVTLSDDDGNLSEDLITIAETIKPDKKLKVDQVSSTRTNSLESLKVNEGLNEIFLYEKEIVQPRSVHHCLNCLFVTLSDEDEEELREDSATSSLQNDKNMFGTKNKGKQGKKRKKKLKETQQNNKKPKFPVSLSFVKSTINEALYGETTAFKSNLGKSSCDPVKNVSHNKLTANRKREKKKLKLNQLKNKRTKLNGSLLRAASIANFALPEETSTAGKSLCKNSCDPVRNVSHKNNKSTPKGKTKKKTKIKVKMTQLKNKITKLNGLLLPATFPANLTIPEESSTAVSSLCKVSCGSVKNISHNNNLMLNRKIKNKTKKKLNLTELKDKTSKLNCSLMPTASTANLAVAAITSTAVLPVSENVNQNIECKENVVCVTLSDTEAVTEKESYGSSSIAQNSEGLRDTVKLKKKVLENKKKPRRCKQKSQKKKKMKMRAISKCSFRQKVSGLCEITNTIDRLPVSENVNQNIECKENVVCVTLSDTKAFQPPVSEILNQNMKCKESIVCVNLSDTENQSHGSLSASKNSEGLEDTVKLKKKILENRKKSGRCRQNPQKKNKKKMRATSKHSMFYLSKKSKSGNDVSWNPSLHSLRPVVIDGSNVAIAHGRVSHTFSSKGIQLAVDYFLNRGHTQVTAFVPYYRRRSKCHHSFPTVDREILENLAVKQHVVFTPSRYINGKCIVSYDDRFIVQLASENGGIIVSNDSYKDLINESELFREAIEERLLMFCFVGDKFMVPEDPLGREGPRLQEYLCFPEEYTAV